MPGRMTTPIKVIEQSMSEAVQYRLRLVAKALCNAGEQCIIEAREHGDYSDWSGNLRSSIGYAVLIDGKVFQLAMVEKTLNGDKGTTEGLAFLKTRIAKASKKGVVLIVTAGMNYADYVETKKNVLSSAKLQAPRIAKELLARLGFKVK